MLEILYNHNSGLSRNFVHEPSTSRISHVRSISRNFAVPRYVNESRIYPWRTCCNHDMCFWCLWSCGILEDSFTKIPCSEKYDIFRTSHDTTMNPGSTFSVFVTALRCILNAFDAWNLIKPQLWPFNWQLSPNYLVKTKSRILEVSEYPSELMIGT